MTNDKQPTKLPAIETGKVIETRNGKISKVLTQRPQVTVHTARGSKIWSGEIVSIDEPGMRTEYHGSKKPDTDSDTE